jgi:hypothetical protein
LGLAARMARQKATPTATPTPTPKKKTNQVSALLGDSKRRT